jgi:glycerophosphoryl diester phosphodiesterase
MRNYELKSTNHEFNYDAGTGRGHAHKSLFLSLFVFFMLFVTGCWDLSYAGPVLSLPKPPRQGGVYVVAHRGAHQGIPENTLAAYAKAIELGADFVEIDTRATKDDKTVSMHNGNVDAYTKDAKGPVSGFTLAELKAMDIGSRVGPEWKNERIPELGEILDLCRGRIGIYIDLKAAPVDQVVKMLRDRGMERDCVWYVGGSEITDLQKSCPECFPMPEPGTKEGLQQLLDTFKLSVIASSFKNLSPDFVKMCHENHAAIIVDDLGPITWMPMLEWKVDGIQTDEPAELIKQLKERDNK